MTNKEQVLKRLLEEKVITFEEMLLLNEKEKQKEYIYYCNCNKLWTYPYIQPLKTYYDTTFQSSSNVRGDHTIG